MVLRDAKVVVSRSKDCQVLLFGKTIQLQSICLVVTDYRFSVTIKPPMGAEVDIDTINEICREPYPPPLLYGRERYEVNGIHNDYPMFKPDKFDELEMIQLEPVLGYSGGVKDELYRLYLASGLCRTKKLFTTLESAGYTVVDKKISKENLFLNESGLLLQQGCEWVSGRASARPIVRTFGVIDRWEHISMRKLKLCDIKEEIPVRISILRIANLRREEEGCAASVCTYSTDNVSDCVWKVFHKSTGTLIPSREVVDYLKTLKHNAIVSLDDKFDTREELRRAHTWGDESRYFTGLPGVMLINLTKVYQKAMVSPPLEGFSLEHLMSHPAVYRQGPSAYEGLQGEVEVIKTIVDTNTILVNFIEYSAASHTRIEQCVDNGQQIRVWNKLCHRFHHERLYVNSDILKYPAAMVRMRQEDSTYPVGATAQVNAVSNAKGFTGGAVRAPIPGFHTGCVSTLDFASLYPSIIQGFEICFRRLCYSEQHLTDPNLRREYVAITNEKSVVLITGEREHKNAPWRPTPTVLPGIIREVVVERARIKTELKMVTDTFKRAVLNAKQLGCKVFQNSVYGFLGANPRFAYFACPELMAVTCALGRYMIQTVADVVETKFNGIVIYGDTDSVLVQLPVEQTSSQDPQVCLGAIYKTCKDICLHCNTLFPPPNELEMECMYCPFFVGEKKKMYSGLKYPASPQGWKLPPELVMKGLACTKRDRAPFVRKLGHFITEALMSGREGTILDKLKATISSLMVTREITEFILSTVVRRPEEYKSRNLIQVQTVMKYNENPNHHPLAPGARLQYVVLQGQGPLYGRGCPIECFNHGDHKLDMKYYIHKQLVPAIFPLFTFHRVLWEQVVTDVIEGSDALIYQKQNTMRPIQSYFSVP